MVNCVDIPLHERIAQDLRARVLAGEFPVGAPIPSEAELCLQWSGSRGPVRQALATLRAEGLIAGGRGKPPTVQRQQVTQPFDSFLSFSHWVELLGRTPGQHTVEIARRPAPVEIAAHLRIEPGEPVVQLRRQRLLDDEPVMVERTSFPLRFGAPLFEYDTDSGSIYAFLIGRGLRVGVARHVMDAVAADADDSTLLGIDVGAPLLRERRTALTADGEVFEFSDDRYRPDRISFTIDNAPEGQPLLGRTWTELTDDLTDASSSRPERPAS
jgi:GntR family transcriptional regulator